MAVFLKMDFLEKTTLKFFFVDCRGGGGGGGGEGIILSPPKARLF